MTWYWWNHWFWITAGLTVIFVLTFNNCVSSYPISPFEEIKEYNNNKNLQLKYPINSPTLNDDDHDIDDVYMGQQLPSQLLKNNLNKIIEQMNNNNKKLNEFHHQEKIENNFNNNNKTIEDNLILNKNQTYNNNNNNHNLNNISNVIKLVPFDSAISLSDNKNINKSENKINNQTIAKTENNINLKDVNFSNFSNISINNNKTLDSINQLNESTDSTNSNIMQIKKNYNINSTILLPPLPPQQQQPLSTLLQSQIFDDQYNESTTTMIFDNTADNYDSDDEIGNITKLDLVITTTTKTQIDLIKTKKLLLNDNTTTESNEKISTKLENVTKMINDSNGGNNSELEYVRKSKGLLTLSSEYRDGSRSINFPISETKNLLTRSATSSDTSSSSNLQLFAEQQHEDGNVSSEALQITGVMDAGTISGICFSVFALCIGVSMFGIILYRRRFLNKPQTLNEPDSSVYIDDSTIRDNSDEMYSLDNDSFLNSLEAMTIQNYWTDTVKHTKL